MDKSKKVSVIIPTYNCEKYINETIDSVISQTFRNIEIIVVDDGSVDKTIEMVKSYGSLVLLIEQPNAGVCSARNCGASLATGDFICFMDHDDYWFKDKVSRQVNAFNSNAEIGAVFSTFINWRADTAGVFPVASSFDTQSDSAEIDQEFSGWIYHKFLLDCWALMSCTMFRMEAFLNCGKFDELLPYSEDWDLLLRISRQYKMIKLIHPTTLYRQHTQQGNRVIRNIDYRTLLLTTNAKNFGRSSKDGRSISSRDFSRQLSTYHSNFAQGHLLAGNKTIAVKSLLKAWSNSPLSIKLPLYLLGALIGWRQKKIKIFGIENIL